MDSLKIGDWVLEEKEETVECEKSEKDDQAIQKLTFSQESEWVTGVIRAVNQSQEFIKTDVENPRELVKEILLEETSNNDKTLSDILNEKEFQSK